MKPRNEPVTKKIRAIKVHQWLDEWDQVKFGAKHRAKPQPHFYLFSLKAEELKALSGIERRTTGERLRNKEDLGIQRRHDPARSDEIRRFIEFGYPWSELSDAKRRSGDYDDLRKPGWLPTAVVVNVIGAKDRRRGLQVAKPGDLVYCDPTYTVAHNNNGFIRYNESNFRWSDQQRLARVCLRLQAQGTTVVVSNAYHDEVRVLYPTAEVLEVNRLSLLCPKAEKRKSTKEYLFLLKPASRRPARTRE